MLFVLLYAMVSAQLDVANLANKIDALRMLLLYSADDRIESCATESGILRRVSHGDTNSGSDSGCRDASKGSHSDECDIKEFAFVEHKCNLYRRKCGHQGIGVYRSDLYSYAYSCYKASHLRHLQLDIHTGLRPCSYRRDCA